MSALFFFSALIFSCFSQTNLPDFECCNNCQEIGPGNCAAPFFWPDKVCDQYEPPFWPYNFCPNSGEECKRGTCHCTRAYDAVYDPDTGDVSQIRLGDICVRSLPYEDDVWGTWLCDNSRTCDDGVCPENHYCVDACCGDGRRRCVPCCNEPLLQPPTDEPTRDPIPAPTNDPTMSPIPKPTRDPTMSPVPKPTNDPIPTPGGECPCEFPQDCVSPFTWEVECVVSPWMQQDTIICPTGQQFDIWSQCRCTFDFTEGNPSDLEGVCIKDPYTDEWDQRMCQCAQVCQPGNPNQCPPNHYCVHTCCEQFGGEPFHCVPCCNEKWIIHG